jgi:Kef-type K+ transport system membrane component KefB
VIVPFFITYFLFFPFGLQALESMLVVTAPTATSIVILIQVSTELGKMRLKDASIIQGAAMVEEILSIAMLSVVTTMVRTGTMTPEITNIIILVLKILGFFVHRL